MTESNNEVATGEDSRKEKGGAATPKNREAPSNKKLLPLIIAAGCVLVLLASMVLNTRFVGAEEQSMLNPEAFDAAKYAAKTFPEIKTKVTAKAVDLKVLIPAAETNLSAAGSKYGINVSGKYYIPVKITAAVKSVDANWVTLDTPEVPGSVVRIPLGAALSGTPIRDVTGDIVYGHFTDQTDFQQVANEYRIIMQRDLIKPLATASLTGKQVSVVGAWVSGGAAKQYIVQPVSLKVK